MTALGRVNVFGSTLRQASTLLDPHWGNTVLGYLQVGAENAHSEPKHINLGSLKIARFHPTKILGIFVPKYNSKVA